MLLNLLDASIVASALAASALWLRASRGRLRRVSKHENLDHGDFNLLVTALNRTQILNSYAALATGLAAALAGLRFVTGIA